MTRKAGLDNSETLYQTVLDENERLKAELYRYQEYDQLTGLYNKSTFEDKVREWIDNNREGSFDIVCIDIEQFKVINDVLGMEQGDRILREVGAVLKRFCGERQWLSSRISADVFGVCIASEACSSFVDFILRQFEALDFGLKITPAIGIYTIEDKTLPVLYMCDNALLALNTVKGSFQVHFARFGEKMRKAIVAEQEIRGDAQRALENREFKVYIQPKCNMNTGKIVGGEALIRWQHPEKGLIMPDKFIPLFERNGFIKDLDRYTWEETVKWLHSLSLRGIQPVPVSVNVSRIDLLEMDVHQIVRQLVEDYGLDHSLLKIEVTESAYISEETVIIEQIDRMREDGFSVLLDDFGSGYSALNILKDINIDVLKLDMRFLDKDTQKGKDILCSILNMAKWLDLNTIAEGVESSEQVDFLLKIGCYCAQGFYFYRPMPIEAFEAKLLEEEEIDYAFAEESGQNGPLISIRELLYENMISNKVLNNVLGAIALFSCQDGCINIEKGNEQFFELMEVSKSSLKDKLEIDTVFELVDDDWKLMHEGIAGARENLEEGAEITVRHPTRQGINAWLKLRFFFLSKANKKEIYYASVQDISDDMKMVEDLQISEHRFMIAMEATNILLFEVDIATRAVRYAVHTQGDFGLDDTVTIAPEGFIEQGTVCEDSVEDFCDMYREIYAGADRVSRVIHAVMEGREVYNKITLEAVKNKNGQSVKAVGIIQNVTEEVKLNRQLNKKKKDGF